MEKLTVTERHEKWKLLIDEQEKSPVLFLIIRRPAGDTSTTIFGGV